MVCVGVSVITVTKSKLIKPRKSKPGYSILDIRRDVCSDGSYYEYVYSGPTEEVETLAARAVDVDPDKLYELLRKGNDYDAALKALGK
jgi:hypothetical protein